MNTPATVELDDYIDRAQHLPPAPALLPELLSLLNQPNVESSRVVRLITYEPALTASLLRLCNSAAMAPSRPVLNVEEAVLRLGFEQVYRLAAAVSAAPLLRPKQSRGTANSNQLWEHSVTSAIAAQLIARDLGDDRSLVFIAALLNDVGKTVLFQALGDTYSKLIQEVDANQYCLLESEKRVLGVEHAEIGGRLLARWKFPLSLVAAVWFHHHPAAAAPHQRLAAYVYFGNLIAHLVGHGFGHEALALRGRNDAQQILQFKPESLPGYMMQTYGEFSAIRALFKIGA
jgi:putative nucleotidyltransferase with HDIG domain